MKVRAKQKFETIIDSTIGRKRKNGEVFEVSEERAKLLLNNDLVDLIEEPKQEIEFKEEIKEKTEEPITEKKTRKSKKAKK